MSTKTVGNVTLAFVEPDVLSMTWKGSFGVAEADALLAYTDEVKAKVSRLFFVIEVHQATGIDASSRKKIAALTKARPYAASAVVGASFPIKVAVELIINAAKLVNSDQTETRFFSTLAEANAWIDEVRKAAAAA
jgi:hypothetical protein